MGKPEFLYCMLHLILYEVQNGNSLSVFIKPELKHPPGSWNSTPKWVCFVWCCQGGARGGSELLICIYSTEIQTGVHQKPGTKCL